MKRVVTKVLRAEHLAGGFEAGLFKEAYSERHHNRLSRGRRKRNRPVEQCNGLLVVVGRQQPRHCKIEKEKEE